ncbi:alpha-N-acetylglucosaminidase [Trichonephila clavipes]|nr:alpha-N-acetylglucosaminidase [Trichonephila clavipes]
MKTSSRFSPNENTLAIAFEAKPRLIRKENSPPLIPSPVEMLTCPLKTLPPIAGRKWLVAPHKDHIQLTYKLRPVKGYDLKVSYTRNHPFSEKGLEEALKKVRWWGPFEGRDYEGSTMIGTGITPEGIETNDIVYELMNELGWRVEPVDMHEWLENFATRRYGVQSAEVQLALFYLRRSVYNATDPYRNHGKYILIRRPSLKLKPYTNSAVLKPEECP